MSENKAIVQTASSGFGITRPSIQSSEMIDTSWRMAQFAAQSSLTKTNNPYDAFFIIQYGWELGLTPMASLRTIYIVNGVPTCSGEAMLALIRKSGFATEIKIDGDGERASVMMARELPIRESYLSIFTIEDAKKAGLLGKDNWQKHPAKMLKWRAVSECAKFLFGDVIGGLYTVEEIAPDTHVDESGDIVGDIIVDENTPTKMSRPDFSGNGKKQDATTEQNGKHTETKWQDDMEQMRQLISGAVEAGYIERPAKLGDGKVALLQLIDKPDFNEFATFDDAKNAIASEGEKLLAELNNRSADKSQAVEQADESPESESEQPDTTETTSASDGLETLSNKDKAELADWIKANFAGRDMASVSEDLETDWSEYSTIGHAKNMLIKTAETECWAVITDMLTHRKDGKAKYLLLSAVVSDIRHYSRQELVKLLGAEFPDNDKIKALPEGESLILSEKIVVEYEAKGHYNVVTNATPIDKWIPF